MPAHHHSSLGHWPSDQDIRTVTTRIPRPHPEFHRPGWGSKIRGSGNFSVDRDAAGPGLRFESSWSKRRHAPQQVTLQQRVAHVQQVPCRFPTRGESSPELPADPTPSSCLEDEGEKEPEDITERPAAPSPSVL